MWASMGKLVPQLPGFINFSYDLYFRPNSPLERSFWKIYIMLSNSDFVDSLTMESKKTTVLGPKMALVVQKDALT